MAAYVLVHGAWGGSYGFRKLRPPLQSPGHEVFTPSLTGIGERSHLTSPLVNLSTHVRDVVNTIIYEDLDDIVLLGFSYGGMVITGALEHIGDRVRDLVYLDAFVPENGQSVRALLESGEPRPSMALGEEWLIPPIPRELDDPAETAWSNARRTHQPAATFTEPVRLDRPLETWEFSRTFIKASADASETPTSAFWRAARAAEASPAWAYHEVTTSHMVPITQPERLATILLDLVAARAT